MKERKWNKIVSYAVKEPILLVSNISTSLILQATKFHQQFRVCLREQSELHLNNVLQQFLHFEYD